MKKTYLLLIAVNAFVGSITAQTNYIDGVWELAELHHTGDVLPVNMYVVFNEAGEIEISGGNLGTWSRNETENTFTISCKYLGSLEGENKILVLNDEELKISNANGDIHSLKKISLPNNKELDNNIIGEWMFESAETNGETNSVFKPVTFNKNGVFYIQGIVLGTWNYNQSDKTVMLDTRKVKGEHSILKLNNKHLIIKGEAGTLVFTKIDRDNIHKENEASGLIGTWETENKTNPEERNFLIFKTLDTLVYVVKNKNRQQNDNGMWMFNKEDMTLTMIGFYDVYMPEGKSKITKLNNDVLELEQDGKTYTLKKVVQDAMAIEHLTFSEKDFYDETGDYNKYSDDEQKLPWQDSYDMMMKLEPVKQLVYNHSSLIEDVNVFESKILTANVNSNAQEEDLNIDYIFNGYDRNTITEDSTFPSNKLDLSYSWRNMLYPEENNTFRVVEEEEITTSAGTFNCTVVEAIKNEEEKLKLWMINDKPGVFVKIIKENIDDYYGYYHVYELQEIINKK